MTATFLLTLDTGSDTDLVSVADEVISACNENNLVVKSCRPWRRKTLGPMSQTPTVAPSN